MMTPSRRRLNLAAFVEALGGANTALLSGCPGAERNKYAALGTINLALSALAGWLVFAWQEVLPKGLAPPSIAVALPYAFFAASLALGVLFAASRVLSMRQLGSAAYIIGAFLLLPLTGLFGGLVYFRLMLAGSKAEVLTYAGLSIWALLAIVLVRTHWRSPVYDGMLLHESAPQPGEHEAPPNTGGQSTEGEPRERADETLEQTLQAKFERDPHDLNAARRLIEVRKRLNKYDAAAEVVDALLSDYPENIELIRERAELYRHKGDEQRYRKILAQTDPLLAKAAFEQNLGKPIRLTSLEVADLDFFGDFPWAFQPRVNVLLGKNGYGKSNLLRALAAMLQNDEEMVSEFFAGSGRQARMQVDIDRAGESATTIRTRLIFDESFGKVPLLAIPDMRYIDKSVDSIGLAPDPMTDLRRQSAWHFMRDVPYQGMIMKFLYDLCLDYLDHKDFNLPIFVLLQDTVRTLTGSRFEFAEITRRDSATFAIQVLTEGNERNPLPLQKASQGTLSVLSVFGLIYRYLGATHENSPADVASQEGIVIIDEIDAHLHPSWQQAILQLLRDTFPNVQFIVTAHSPLIVAGCRAREVAVLRKAEEKGFAVEVLPQHFIGATSADMYEQVFEVEEKDMTYRRLNTLSGKKPKIEREISKLEKRAPPDAAQQQRLGDLKRELYDLREFEEVKAERSKEEQMKSEYQHLEMEVSQLRGENSALKRKLQAQGDAPAIPVANDLAKLLQELSGPNDAQRALLEATAKSWRESGRNAESATVLETLVRIEPKNLAYLKQLAILYETMEQFRDANRVIDMALRLAPSDRELLSVRTRLKQLLPA